MKSVVAAGIVGVLALCALPQSPLDWGSGAVAGPLSCLSSKPDVVRSGQTYSSGPYLPFVWHQAGLLLISDTTNSQPDSVESPNDRKDSWLKRGGKIAGSIFARIALYLALLVGLVMIPLGLGGTFVMVGAAALFGALTGFDQIGVKLLAVLLGLALLGEGLESVLGVAMARKYGASKWGMWGAFLGGIFGAIVGTPVPVAGNLVGALVGVFAGAFLLEWLGRGLADRSLKAGWGALLGRAAASAIKLGLGMIILILVVARTLS